MMSHDVFIGLNVLLQVVVVPESTLIEFKRSINERGHLGIKENKDYYFTSKPKQKIKNSIANCEYDILMNHKRRKKEGFFYPLQKEDVPSKTCHHIDHPGPCGIIRVKEGNALDVMKEGSESNCSTAKGGILKLSNSLSNYCKILHDQRQNKVTTKTKQAKIRQKTNKQKSYERRTRSKETTKKIRSSKENDVKKTLKIERKMKEVEDSRMNINKVELS
ncbi:hypothetical protein TNCV_3359821 [Trichonephila clavipes]|nr:hypothetical protein TNCV_3359821 [Trichonephila clavipes]